MSLEAINIFLFNTFTEWHFLLGSIILLLMIYVVRLQWMQKELKRINRLNNVIWENVQEYIFLIDSQFHICRTNFYHLNHIKEDKSKKCFGDIMECRHAYENGKCGRHKDCRSCKIRGILRKTLEEKEKFSNCEINMELHLPSNNMELCNVVTSGSYLNLKGEDFILLTVHDISREKKLENTVRKSHEKFLSVFNNLPVGCAICDKNGVLQEVNDSYIDYIGLAEKEEAINKLNIFSNPCVNPEFKDMMKKGIPVSGEVKYDFNLLNERYVKSRHTTVKYYRFIVDYLKDAKGEIEYYVIIWVDNTLIHKTLRENKSFHDMISFASSVSHIGFGSCNLLRGEQIVTPEFIKNLGADPKKTSNNIIALFDKVHPEDRKILVDYLKGAGRKKVEPLEMNLRVEIEGSYCWIKEQIMQQTFDPDGGNIILLGVNIDINAQKQAEEELKNAKEKAESSDRLKSAFIANMSHEIRTPLNAIVGFSDLLALAEEPQEKENYRKIIRHNNDLLLQLITDILDLSKIEADILEFNSTEVNLNELLYDIEQTTRLKNINYPAVRIDFVAGLPECVIYTDRTRISQVMTNFLTNALKFTEKGNILFGYEKRESGLYFYVKDTGCGIPEDKLPFIFQRFVKLNNFKQGTGLGLAICQSIINKLEGVIGVDSKLGVGSTFWFQLPLKILRDETSISVLPQTADILPLPENVFTSVPVTSSSKKLTLLVAEDTIDNYRLFESILSKKYNLIHAWNGQEAVEMYIKHTPDAILMDIRMPNWDGYEATQAIRQISTEVPIIAVTAFAFNEDKKKILASGFNDFLAKPIKAQELLAKLASLNL